MWKIKPYLFYLYELNWIRLKYNVTTGVLSSSPSYDDDDDDDNGDDHGDWCGCAYNNHYDIKNE